MSIESYWVIAPILLVAVGGIAWGGVKLIDLVSDRAEAKRRRQRLGPPPSEGDERARRAPI